MISYLHGSAVVIQFQAKSDMFYFQNLILISFIYRPGAVPQFTGVFHCVKICSGPARVTVVCKGAVGFVWPAHIFSCQSIFTWWLPSARGYQGDFSVERCWNPCKKEDEHQRKTVGRIVIRTQPTIHFGRGWEIANSFSFRIRAIP